MVVLLHRDDDIPLFVPFFDIPVSLDYFLQGIASIYDRLYLPCLDKLFEEGEIFSLYVASGSGIPDNVQSNSLSSSKDFLPREDGIVYCIKDHIIGLTTLGKILLCVINHLISS